MDRKSKQNNKKWGSLNTTDGLLDWTTIDHKILDFWIFGFFIFLIFFSDNVLSGTPNTVSIGEGGPRYFGTSL